MVWSTCIDNASTYLYVRVEDVVCFLQLLQRDTVRAVDHVIQQRQHPLAVALQHCAAAWHIRAWVPYVETSVL